MDIRTLSKKLGLSITTVSRALGGYSDVSEKTRKRVIQFAKKYNYSPNPHASRLASGKSNSVGFVLPLYGLNSSTLNQTAFFQFIAGMSDKIHTEGIQFVMMFANSEEEEKSSYNKLINDQKIDNIILHNITTNDSRIKMLEKRKINYVAWGRTQNKEKFPWVDLDNEKSIELIVQYLISKKHKDIAYINITEKYNFAFQRKNSFLKSLKRNNIKFNKNYYTTVRQEEPELSSKIIKKMLQKYSNITALICSTEYSAVGAIKACDFLNKKIGIDISVITFDGPVVQDLTSPALTAVSHPIKELGNEAITILIENIRNKSNNRFFLAKPKIIERGSVHEIK